VSAGKWTDGNNPFMSSSDDNDSHNTNIHEIIAERNKAQSEAQYWKAEAKRWREVAIDQDGNIEVFIQRLNKRQDDIEMMIRGMKGGC
jgi:hypothetical protein